MISTLNPPEVELLVMRALETVVAALLAAPQCLAEYPHANKLASGMGEMQKLAFLLFFRSPVFSG